MNYPKTVLEIHNEFNSASERLLQQAVEVINNSGVDADKVARLEKAGFKNSVEVRKYQQIKVTSEQAQLIQYYQHKYPLNKFITEEQVMAICKKYRLECAPIDRYKGFVPEGKLKQIESFVTKSGDEAVDLIRITGAWHFGNGLVDFFCYMFKSMGGRYVHNQLGMAYIPVDHPRLYWSGNTPFSVYDAAKEDYRGSGYISSYRVIDKTARLICAPHGKPFR